MRWLGLAPMLAHLISAYLFFRIATIPAGYWKWWMGWAALSGGTAFYAWGRFENVVNVAWYGQPFDLPRIITASVGATCTLTFALCIWNIFKPRQPPAPIPVAQIVMNWRGIIISWNAAATELLGWTEEEAVEKELAALIIPEDFMIPINGTLIAARDLHRQGLQRFRETGASPILDTRFPTKALHKDGRQFDVEVRVNEHLTPLGRTFLGQIVPMSKVTV